MSSDLKLVRGDAADVKRLQLQAECDQRWALASECLWELPAEVAMQLDRLLTGDLKSFRGAVGFNDDVAAAVQHLAALALDELLARGGEESGDE